MDIFIVTTVFILGTIIGSFLNVAVYRFHTGKSLSGRSHCMSCGRTLQWYELIPVLSYVFVLGRCRTCGARISPQYALIELLSGLLFVLVFITTTGIFSIALHLLLVSLLIVLTAYDIRHTIIPDSLVVGLTFVALIVVSTANGTLSAPSVETLLGGVVAAGSFAFLWLISRGRWIGLGDAKLAFPLGLLVGLSDSASFIIFAFWVGALISLLLIGIQYVLKYAYTASGGQLRLGFLRAPLTIKSEVPFAPFLVLSFLLVYFFRADAFLLTYELIALL